MNRAQTAERDDYVDRTGQVFTKFEVLSQNIKTMKLNGHCNLKRELILGYCWRLHSISHERTYAITSYPRQAD